MELLLPEIVAIGVYNSQFAVKDRTITKKRNVTMFEIDLPIEEGGISYINSDEMQILPNFAICAKPGQVRHTKLPFKCYYIHMILKNDELYNIMTNMPDFVEIRNPEKYRELFVKMRKYYDYQIESDKIMIYSLVLKLIHMLYNDSKKQLYRGKMKNNNYEIIEKAIRHIKDNLTSDLSLDTVAAYCALSPIYFHNCFKAGTGKTLHEYVEEQRIIKAANLLVTTDSTLTEISYECGFSSQSYFSYAFKRKMKMTPREYVKEIYKRYDT